MPFFAVQTTVRQEIHVADAINDKDIFAIDAILVPPAMKGYVIIEAEESELIERAITDIHAANKVLPGEMSSSEVRSFLEPKASTEGLTEGAVVEIKNGAYEGQKARIQRINESEEEVTVELHEATVPVPITIPGNHVRVLQEQEH